MDSPPEPLCSVCGLRPRRKKFRQCKQPTTCFECQYRGRYVAVEHRQEEIDAQVKKAQKDSRTKHIRGN